MEAGGQLAYTRDPRGEGSGRDNTVAGQGEEGVERLERVGGVGVGLGALLLQLQAVGDGSPQVSSTTKTWAI